MKPEEFWRRFPAPERDELVRRSIELALQEDLGAEGDLTSLAVVPAEARVRARIVAGSAGVFCGGFLVGMILRRLDAEAVVEVSASEGSRFRAGDTLAVLSGRARAVLAAERVILNFLQQLCGVATATRRWRERMPEGGPLLVDTRKTIPGLRRLQKWAVTCGGGLNHRRSLAEAVMIKDNHKVVWKRLTGRSLAEVVNEARRRFPGIAVEVEVDNEEELREVLPARPDVVLLDNMSPEEIRRCVELCPSGTLVEVSGGITEDRLRDYCVEGVAAISAGALTSSVTVPDLSLEVTEVSAGSGEEER